MDMGLTTIPVSFFQALLQSLVLLCWLIRAIQSISFCFPYWFFAALRTIILVCLDLDSCAMIFLVVHVRAIAASSPSIATTSNTKIAKFYENVLRYLSVGGIIRSIPWLEPFFVVDRPLTLLLLVLRSCFPVSFQ
uniref:Uncharacterized protein ORF134 n=1 Tax=Phaeoceros laevis TaxID=37308 RepID=D3J0I6_9EMBR|nr:hypothetical protein PhlaMp13 [Phaeoceros laevis]ACT75300.1 hypothetical protein PhlaMp13 [Phaeoceros laevis]